MHFSNELVKSEGQLFETLHELLVTGLKMRKGVVNFLLKLKIH